MKKTIVFDFDGVIHSYRSGWQGYDVIPDPPVEGIKELIEEVRKDYKVVVVSTRCGADSGLKAVKNYLIRHGIVVDDVVKVKPPAVMYVDDRGVCFDGDVDKLLDTIKNFKSWLEKEREQNGR